MKKLLASKKGVMFTIVAILVSAIVITSFFALQDSKVDSNIDNVKLRVKTSNLYVEQLDNYIKDMILITGDSALDFIVYQMISRGAYYDVSSFDAEFERCLMDGEIRTPGNENSVIPCGSDAYLTGEIAVLDDFVNENLNLQSTITLNAVRLNQTDPWNILVTAAVGIDVSDGYATWQLNKNISQKISIINRTDPSYWINANPRKYMLNITRANFGGIWLERTSTLNKIVIDKQYFVYSGAPNYLNKLRNSSKTSVYGIVSIVPTSLVGTIPAGSSSLDFMYWNEINCEPDTSNGGNYYLFDFWPADGDVTESERVLYGINDTQHGINGTIVPRNMAIITNMTDSDYLVDVVIAPNC